MLVGHSLGGWMSNRLACIRGDIIRGTAAVGGTPADTRNCTGTADALVLQHPEDKLVPYKW
jgi:polyhydroxybutyrate depolymerase